MNGIAPAALGIHPQPGEPAPLVYNFALSGSGNVRVLMTFRRLLAAGVRPDRLLVETWPPMWPEDGSFDEKQILLQDDLRWTDLPVLHRCLPGYRPFLVRARGSV